MSSRVVFPPKKPGETALEPFDFSSQLAAGETISTAGVTVSVWSGTDPSPGSLVSGAASIAAGVVSQAIQGGVSGVIYTLLCQVTTSLGQTLNMSGFLAVLGAQP